MVGPLRPAWCLHGRGRAARRLELRGVSLIDTGSFLWICVSLAVGQVFVAMMYGPQAAFVAEMFTTDVRYSGASLGYQLGAILGGGFAPIIATALLAEYQDTVGISIYMAIACAITLWSTWLLGETAGARAVDGADYCVANVPSMVFQESLLPVPEKISVKSRPPL
jgi:MFS family permease